MANGSAKIYTHLWYAKEAEEAARLYASIFPDSRVDRAWSVPSDSPSGPAGSMKVVDFTLLGQRFQAITAGPHHDFNDDEVVLMARLRVHGFGISIDGYGAGPHQDFQYPLGVGGLALHE